ISAPVVQSEIESTEVPIPTHSGGTGAPPLAYESLGPASVMAASPSPPRVRRNRLMSRPFPSPIIGLELAPSRGLCGRRTGRGLGRRACAVRVVHQTLIGEPDTVG